MARPPHESGARDRRPNTFLLVHGAFRGGWAWERVADILRSAGHTVHTPSLTGMGDRAHLTGGRITLATWTADVRAVADTYDLTKVVLVGHSQGGLVVRAAANDLGDRLAAVAYLDAPVPQRGERGIDLNPGGPPDPSLLPPADLMIPPTTVVPADDLDDTLAEWMNQRLSPTPFGPSLDRVASPAPDVPTHVAFCSLTPTTYPCWVTRHRMDAAGERYTVLDAGHDAPLTRPGLVADWLESLRLPAGPPGRS